MFKLKHLFGYNTNIRLINLNLKFSTNINGKTSFGLNLIDSADSDVYKLMNTTITIKEDFITEAEEESLLREVEPLMKKKRYEFDHWDNAIHGFRETERKNWAEENQIIFNRLKQFAFENTVSNQKIPSNILSHVHILDLHEDGYIKPHIDAVRYCGNIIAGMSLLSDSVMKFVNEKDNTKFGFALLKRRSLYVMRDEIRYNYTHEILKKSESFFKSQNIIKNRRISIVCRNEPNLDQHPEAV